METVSAELRGIVEHHHAGRVLNAPRFSERMPGCKSLDHLAARAGRPSSPRAHACDAPQLGRTVLDRPISHDWRGVRRELGVVRRDLA